MESAASPACPQPRNFRSQNFKTSELYSPMFGENPEAVECGDGKIISISNTPVAIDFSSRSLEETAALAAQIMGVQP